MRGAEPPQRTVGRSARVGRTEAGVTTATPGPRCGPTPAPPRPRAPVPTFGEEPVTCHTDPRPRGENLSLPPAEVSHDEAVGPWAPRSHLGEPEHRVRTDVPRPPRLGSSRSRAVPNGRERRTAEPRDGLLQTAARSVARGSPRAATSAGASGGIRRASTSGRWRSSGVRHPVGTTAGRAEPGDRPS